MSHETHGPEIARVLALLRGRALPITAIAQGAKLKGVNVHRLIAFMVDQGQLRQTNVDAVLENSRTAKLYTWVNTDHIRRIQTLLVKPWGRIPSREDRHAA